MHHITDRFLFDLQYMLNYSCLMVGSQNMHASCTVCIAAVCVGSPQHLVVGLYQDQAGAVLFKKHILM